MPYLNSQGVQLYYEEAGRGLPMVFVHEFADDLRSWEAQLRYFSRRYRCIAFNARGYPPSDVPAALSKYSPTAAVEDIANVIRQLRLVKAHIVGCSMGGYATLLFGLKYAHMARSLTAIGAGSGSDPARRTKFLKASAAAARRFENEGLKAALKPYLTTANRVQLRIKDPRAFTEFKQRFMEQSALGHANTIRGVTMRRPAIYRLERQLARLSVPTHLVVGDEDDDLLEPGVFMKRVCRAARLTIVPASGHVVNIEEPVLFNQITSDFLSLVDTGSWRPRDARAVNTYRTPVKRRRG